jgi:hypothetical protein
VEGVVDLVDVERELGQARAAEAGGGVGRVALEELVQRVVQGEHRGEGERLRGAMQHLLLTVADRRQSTTPTRWCARSETTIDIHL